MVTTGWVESQVFTIATATAVPGGTGGSRNTSSSRSSLTSSRRCEPQPPQHQQQQRLDANANTTLLVQGQNVERLVAAPAPPIAGMDSLEAMAGLIRGQR